MKMGIKFDKNPLAVEENNYATKIVNSYILYDLNTWPRNPTNNFEFKNCLFAVTSIVKNTDEEKWVYSDYEITFDGAGSWNFGNGFTGNVANFGVDNISSYHADNRKNNFLVLGENLTSAINGSFDSLEKKISINLNKARTKFCLSLDYNDSKSDNENVNFPTQFCLGGISNGFGTIESRELYL